MKKHTINETTATALQNAVATATANMERISVNAGRRVKATTAEGVKILAGNPAPRPAGAIPRHSGYTFRPRLTPCQRECLATWRVAVNAVEREHGRKGRYIAVVNTSAMGGASTLTPCAWHYMDAVAPRLAYTACKTAFQKSAHPTVGAILDEARDAFRRGRYEDAITAWDEALTPEYHKRKKAGLYVLVEEYVAPEDVTGDAKEAQARLTSTMRFDDLVSVAKTALVEMAERGLINSYEDVWHNAKYVYNAINRAIHGERRQAAQTDRMHRLTSTVDKDGISALQAIPDIRDMVADVEVVDMAERIASALVEVTGREYAGTVWLLTALEYTQADIARKLDVTDRTIRNINTAIKAVLPAVLADMAKRENEDNEEE